VTQHNDPQGSKKKCKETTVSSLRLSLPKPPGGGESAGKLSQKNDRRKYQKDVVRSLQEAP